MIACADIHFVHDVFRHSDRVDKECGLIGDGRGQRINVVHACEHEIAIEPVRRFACNAKSIGCTFVFGDTGKVYA